MPQPRQQLHEEQNHRWRTFQRETLLELQEAINDQARTVGEIHHHDTMAAREAGKWVRPLLGDDLNRRANEADRRVWILASRVADDQLRGEIRRMGEAVARMTLTRSHEESDRVLMEMTELMPRINDRIGQLIRELA